MKNELKRILIGKPLKNEAINEEKIWCSLGVAYSIQRCHLVCGLCGARNVTGFVAGYRRTCLWKINALIICNHRTIVCAYYFLPANY